MRHKKAVLALLLLGISIGLAPSCIGQVDGRIFRPDPMPREVRWTGTAPVEVTTVTADGVRLSGYWWAPTRPGAPVLVFFHGQSGNRFEAATMAAALVTDGQGVLIASYRGYGDNPGKPSETGLYADGDAFVRLAATLASGTDLYVCGFSLGSAVALHAGTASGVRGIVTIGAFTRLADLAPPLARAFVGKRFDNLDAIARVEKAVLLIHGTADEVVPFAHAERLRAAARHARLLRLPGAPHRLDFAQLAPMLWRNLAQMPASLD
jgi:uncharacterized protein